MIAIDAQVIHVFRCVSDPQVDAQVIPPPPKARLRLVRRRGTGILFIALTIGKAYSRPEDLESEEEKAAAVQLLDEKRWRNQEFPGQVGVGRFA